MSDTLYERYTTGTSDSGIHDDIWKAQTFTIGNTGDNVTHNVTSVKIKIYRTGSPGTITVSIRDADVDEKPTGEDLTSGTLDGNSITDDSGGDWYEITLTPYELSESTQYAIVVGAPDGDGSNTISWKYDYSASYTGGKICSSNNGGDSWTNGGALDNSDATFEEYGAVASSGSSKKAQAMIIF